MTLCARTARYPDSCCSKHVSGTTLVELLVAAAVSILVIVALFSLFYSITREAEGQIDPGSAIALGLAIDTMARDINCATIPLSVTQGVFTLVQTPDSDDASLTLSFYTATPGKDETSLRFYAIERIVYALCPAETGAHDLVRTATILHEDKPASVDSMCRITGDFSLAAYSGEAWTNEWAYDTSGTLPAAVKIAIDVPGKEPLVTHVFIPTARPVTKTDNKADTSGF